MKRGNDIFIKTLREKVLMVALNDLGKKKRRKPSKGKTILQQFIIQTGNKILDQVLIPTLQKKLIKK